MGTPGAAATMRRYKGVSWFKARRMWYAFIIVDGSNKSLGCFSTAEEAARAFDAEARQHGKPVNFPLLGEVQAVPGRQPRKRNDAPAATPPAEGDVRYKGAVWNKKSSKWQVRITVAGENMGLGLFLTAEEAAPAHDVVARQHGLPVNFPLPGEEQAMAGPRPGERSDALAATPPAEEQARYKGVGWHKTSGKWHAWVYVGRAQKNLGFFLTAEEAARAFDVAARKRGKPVNFPLLGEDQAVPGRPAERSDAPAATLPVEGQVRYKGVSWNKTDCKWRAFMKVDGVSKSLGHFLTAEEAARARDAEARKHGKPVNFPLLGEVQAVHGLHPGERSDAPAATLPVEGQWRSRPRQRKTPWARRALRRRCGGTRG